MVDVVAKVHGLGVYLAGEKLSCTITFTNHSSVEETIAWAGAQLHCQACFREDVVRVDSSHLPPQSPSTNTTFVPNRGSELMTFLLSVCTCAHMNFHCQYLTIMCICMCAHMYTGERGHTLLSTPTSVLFCNLTLNPGETKSGETPTLLQAS